MFLLKRPILFKGYNIFSFLLFNFYPPILVELHLSDEEFCPSVLLHIVGMRNEKPLTVKLIGGTMTYAEELFAWTCEIRASSMCHILAFLVEIRTACGA